ncbi:MAG: hypothetical protein HYX96_04770 [Chloroflexi bacterium]|nr:hypothetical protein [Chloroflexota bacterium]
MAIKKCPRCRGGDIRIDRDEYGWYEQCIMCGYMRDLVLEVRSVPELVKPRRGTR